MTFEINDVPMVINPTQVKRNTTATPSRIHYRERQTKDLESLKREFVVASLINLIGFEDCMLKRSRKAILKLGGSFHEQVKALVSTYHSSGSSFRSQHLSLNKPPSSTARLGCTLSQAAR
jgi:hypothetical protein